MRRLDQTLLDQLQDRARMHIRKRANLNVHPRLEDPIQRFFNALQPGSYVRPHRHLTPPRWELFLVLQGQVLLLMFDNKGEVIDRVVLQAGGPTFGVELAAGVWHSLVALEPATIFEVKEGPYSKATDKDFATWAPAEGDERCAAWVAWFLGAAIGDRAPNLI